MSKGRGQPAAPEFLDLQAGVDKAVRPRSAGRPDCISAVVDSGLSVVDPTGFASRGHALIRAVSPELGARRRARAAHDPRGRAHAWHRRGHGDTGRAGGSLHVARQPIKRGGGHAMIFGRPVCEPLSPNAEGLLIAELDPDWIAIAQSAADPVGHYSLRDVARAPFDPASPPQL